MKTHDDALREQIDHGVEALKQLRDEIRLELHLASMDAKDAWKKLEPSITGLEKAATATTQATREKVTELVQQARLLKDAITGARPG